MGKTGLLYIIDLYDRIFLKHIRSLDVIEDHLLRLGKNSKIPRVFIYNEENELPKRLEICARRNGFLIRMFKESKVEACDQVCDELGLAAAIIVPAIFPMIEQPTIDQFYQAYAETEADIVVSTNVPRGITPCLVSKKILKELTDDLLINHVELRNHTVASICEIKPNIEDGYKKIIMEAGSDMTLLNDQGMFEVIVNVLLRGKEISTEIESWLSRHRSRISKSEKDSFYFSSDEKLLRTNDRLSRFYLKLPTYDGDKKTWPFSFSFETRMIRYNYVPAKDPSSQALIIKFHGHGPNASAGRHEALDNYHLLMPWDFFGYRRQGSWFWGEKGDNFVERLVRTLVCDVCKQHGLSDIFCFGESMGGFAAIYHAIQYGYDGVYAGMPQIDLYQLMLKDNFHRDNPYAYLKGIGTKDYPDILSIARSKSHLPPLFIDMHLKDTVNPFKLHARKLLNIYDEKDAWYGLAVEPASGHFMKGTLKDAVIFFDRIRAAQHIKHI